MIERFTAPSGAGEVRIVLRPNRSLSRSALWRVVAGMAVVVALVGALSWWQGNVFAPVFALLEAGLLAGCLFWVWRRAEQAELISLGPDRLCVRRLPELVDVFEAHPAWVRLDVIQGRLLVRSSGRRIELGSALGEVEKRRLAQELAGLLERFRDGSGPRGHT